MASITDQKTSWTSDELNKLAAQVAIAGPFSARSDSPRRSVPTIVQNTGVSGHGWVQNGSGVASQSLNDTTDFCIGSQSAKVTSTGLGATCQLRKLGGTSTDLTGKQVVLWVKVDDITHLSQVTFYAGDTSLANFYRWTIFLRGSSSYYWWRSGEWMRVVINWQDLATTTGSPSRAAITDWQVFFTDDNTGNAITGHVQAIGVEPEPSTQFANGVVSFTFDDSYDSQYTEARKKLSQYGYPATAYTIWDQVGASGRMTAAQLREMQNVNGWEIACHSYTAADHDAGLETLTPTQVEYNFAAMKVAMAANGLTGLDNFAYPMGHWTSATKLLTTKYFTTSRLIDDTLHETYPPAEPQLLRCRTVINTDTTAAINTLIDNAKTNHGWLILCFHKIVTSPAASTEYSIANFGTIVDHVNSSGIGVDTVAGVLSLG